MASMKPKSPSVTDLYDIDQAPVGEGAFGYVRRGRHKLQRKTVALKTFKKSNQSEPNSQTVYREISLLRELKHENIVKLEDIFVDTVNKELTIAFEYAEYDLLDIIKAHTTSKSRPNHNPHPMSDGMVKSLLWQLLNGIHYLHSNWVIHRDMKPSNILVMGVGSEAGMVKIADLGLARIFQAPLKPLSENGLVVTIWYRAPEILLGTKHYTKAIDMWAMGCIFAEMMIRTPIFPGNEKKGLTEFQSDQLLRISGWAGKLTPEIWSDCTKLPHWSKLQEMNLDEKRPIYAQYATVIHNNYGQHALDLLNDMLNYNPLKRITAKEALQHPYFTQKRNPPSMNSFDYEPTWESLYQVREAIQLKNNNNNNNNN